MFECKFGDFIGKDKSTINNIKKWSLKYFNEDIKSRPSLHRYIKTLPKEIIKEIDKIRYSKKIKNNICKQFKQCNLISLKETDEIYISHVNYDNGGDQGLFDKHYDGNLRFISNPKIVRALIYISSNGNLKVVFDDCKKSKKFKSFEYALLDFNKEYHWVEGEYNQNEKIPRIILKCNYMICENCSTLYQKLTKFLNLMVFYIVKYSMEYSKSPKTNFQKIIGFFCNLFRKINNYNPILSFLFGFLLIFIIIAVIYLLTFLIILIRNYK